VKNESLENSPLNLSTLRKLKINYIYRQLRISYSLIIFIIKLY